MKWTIYLFLIIGFIFSIQAKKQNISNNVYVLTHEWCRKCDNVIKIIQKLKANFEKENKSQDQANSKLKIESIHLFNDFLQQGQDIKIKSIPNSQYQQQSELFIKKNEKNLILQRVYSNIKAKYGLDKSEIAFPTIWIECPYYTGFYQNQLTYPQLSDQINIYCMGQIPKCPQNKNINKQISLGDYYFRLSQQDFQKHRSQIVSFQIQNPQAKFCISYNNNQQQVAFNQVKYQIQQGPLFFTSFNYNLRNYLYSTKSKLGIFLIFNNPSHPKLKQFIDIFKFISDSLKTTKQNHLNQGKLSSIFSSNSSNKFILQSQYHQSNLKNYDFLSKELIYKNLVFVGACYNQNKRECLMNYQYSIETNTEKREKDPTQRPIIEKFKVPLSFGRSKTHNLKKLLSFSHLNNIFQSQIQQKQKHRNSKFQIIAFHFDKESHQIKGNVFKESDLKLGNDFLFWLQKVYQQTFQKNNEAIIMKDKQSYQTSCLSSQIVHYLRGRNLTAIRNNVKLAKFIQKFNEDQQEHLRFRTINIDQSLQTVSFHERIFSKKWKSQYFQICIKNQSIKTVDSYKQTIVILSSLKNSNQITSQFQQQNQRVSSDQL